MPPTSDENLVPCPHCQQHHQLSDTTCPHCGGNVESIGSGDPGILSSTDPNFNDLLEMRLMYGPPGYPGPDQGSDDLEGKEQEGRS